MHVDFMAETLSTTIQEIALSDLCQALSFRLDWPCFELYYPAHEEATFGDFLSLSRLLDSYELNNV